MRARGVEAWMAGGRVEGGKEGRRTVCRVHYRCPIPKEGAVGGEIMACVCSALDITRVSQGKDGRIGGFSLPSLHIIARPAANTDVT